LKEITDDDNGKLLDGLLGFIWFDGKKIEGKKITETDECPSSFISFRIFLSFHSLSIKPNGPLVSEIDEASCISRSQSYLISKLRKYEELHRKCGPHLTLELPIKR
jgi:hypothetical protein